MQALQRVLATNQEAMVKHDDPYALSRLAAAYLNAGDTRRAIAYYQQALAAFRQRGDRLGEGRALRDVRAAYKLLIRVQKEIVRLEQDVRSQIT